MNLFIVCIGNCGIRVWGLQGGKFYVIQPKEELPRKLEYLTFVMHAPDDYFCYRKAAYPTVSIQTDQQYVVTWQGLRVRMTNSERPVYQDIVPPLIPMNVQN